MLNLTFNVEPQPKLRARSFKRGEKMVTITPDKTAHAENLIKDIALKYLEAHGAKPPVFEADLPLRACVTFYIRPPKYMLKKKSIDWSRPQPVAKKPDLDNYEKLLFDALNGIFYVDDCQISGKSPSEKLYAPPGTIPRIVLSLWSQI